MTPKPVPTIRPDDDPMSQVWVTFDQEHIHAGMPFGPGDTIRVELHNAQSIEAFQSGHRVPDPVPGANDR